MASKKFQLESLKNVPLFNACSKKELETVAKAADEIMMTEGSLIVDQGQTGREAFVILSGEVTIKRSGRKVATLGAGDVVGELSLLDHGPRTASAICATDCTLLVIDQRRFIGVLNDVPSIAYKLMGVLASRIRQMDRTVFG
ncbi:MAG: CRP/FNR family cyclic AMP-dependent transcriptional regulator [Candidatus Azotimanducaceae bacterium]|jgi:CRP/FNR family cyclic AMP-dependent transcriptional regulator